MQVGFSQGQTNALVVRHACTTLQQLGPGLKQATSNQQSHAYLCLMSVLVNTTLPEGGWYTAAEASVKTIFATHPRPVVLCTAVLKRLAHTAFSSSSSAPLTKTIPKP